LLLLKRGSLTKGEISVPTIYLPRVLKLHLGEKMLMRENLIFVRDKFLTLS
jgi:hypothetical protein